MKKNGYFLLFAVIVAAAITSCGNNNTKAPDTSAIKLSIQTYRFDQDIHRVDTNHIADGLQRLNGKYPDFAVFFTDTLLPMVLGISQDPKDAASAISDDLHLYLTNKDYVLLQDTIDQKFPDTKKIDEELTDGFKIMKLYLPEIPVPRIYYINYILSKHPSFLADPNTACISLDMFLGPQYPYYASVGVPDYLAPHLRSNYIPVSLFSTIYNAYHPFATDDKTLLDQMIQRGKEQYFLHKMLPAHADSVLFGFTQNQVNWCTNNEASLYNFFIQQNLLFNKEEMRIVSYVNDGPFAKGIGSPTDPGKPTPGNVGSWLGYKIVSSYMAQYPKTTLKELISQHSDAARFLDSAKYKPR